MLVKGAQKSIEKIKIGVLESSIKGKDKFLYPTLSMWYNFKSLPLLFAAEINRANSDIYI